MERELYRSLYELAYQLGRARRTKHVVFRDTAIVMVYLWAVLHDRPIRWACRDDHWPSAARRSLTLPSESTMSRRLRRVEVRRLIDAVEAALCRRRADERTMIIDAKPLPVGPGTKDPDAAAGFAGAGKGKGYKLHLICDSRRIPRAWCVVAMNHNESVIAPSLIDQLPARAPFEMGQLLGDTAYDCNHLYDRAGVRGWQLHASKRPGRTLGHRRHSPYRLIAHESTTPAERLRLSNERKGVERCFAHLTAGTLGLKPLPSWVRGLRRVTQWVQMKIIVYLAVRTGLHVRNAT